MSTLLELVNKGWTNNSPRNNDSLKEKIDERLKSIERSMIYTQNNSLSKLTKTIEILNSPLDIDRQRDIIVLNTTESSNNEKNNRYTGNTICLRLRLVRLKLISENQFPENRAFGCAVKFGQTENIFSLTGK